MNKESTRYASSIQEHRIAKKFEGEISANSGAAKFSCGDVILKDIGILIECKTAMKEVKSFSIRKDWLNKSSAELFASRCNNNVIAFNFDFNDKKDYYVIDDKLMKFLVDKLREENS